MEETPSPKKKLVYHDSEYEYVNGMSKKAWPGLVLTLVVSVAFYIFAVLRYRELVDWEATGGRIRMTSTEKLCYDMGGVWLFPALIGIFATVVMVLGIKQYLRRKRLG
ncbi:MAG: hypothetical protein J7623_07025 [Chitinophaga sp.]|uniref:hypothetical protein n=1 Tax=Chitinophaga sp. TaxID=1869181 RepID=UPI001B251FD3|nr:hypothetical protein [Chitinophaga sp.]MBO9728376.1 hypothetical protein [Chitinophaga sp.]